MGMSTTPDGRGALAHALLARSDPILDETDESDDDEGIVEVRSDLVMPRPSVWEFYAWLP